MFGYMFPLFATLMGLVENPFVIKILMSVCILTQVFILITEIISQVGEYYANKRDNKNDQGSTLSKNL
jgi:hypothetical protein